MQLWYYPIGRLLSIFFGIEEDSRSTRSSLMYFWRRVPFFFLTRGLFRFSEQENIELRTVKLWVLSVELYHCCGHKITEYLYENQSKTWTTVLKKRFQILCKYSSIQWVLREQNNFLWFTIMKHIFAYLACW